LTPSLINDRNGFQGIWPAMLTPLDAQLNIDHAKLATHALSLIDKGCGGVTLFGTTGEGPSFSLQERKYALEQLIAQGVPA
jgi:4-hydroxy-tetrahydrodipicolinate synthase